MLLKLEQVRLCPSLSAAVCMTKTDTPDRVYAAVLQANALQSQAKQTAGADAVQQTVAAAQLLSLQEGQKLNASSAGEALALAQGHAQQLQTVQAELGMLAQQLQGQMHMQQTLMTMMQQQQMQVQALQAAGVNPEVPHSVAASEPAGGTDSAGTHLTVEELSKKVKAFQTSQRAAVKMLVIEFQKLQDQVKEVAASGGAAVAGSATGAVGIATMAERLAALEQRMQAGQVRCAALMGSVQMTNG